MITKRDEEWAQRWAVVAMIELDTADTKPEQLAALKRVFSALRQDMKRELKALQTEADHSGYPFVQSLKS